MALVCLLFIYTYTLAMIYSAWREQFITFSSCTLLVRYNLNTSWPASLMAWFCCSHVSGKVACVPRFHKAFIAVRINRFREIWRCEFTKDPSLDSLLRQRMQMHDMYWIYTLRICICENQETEVRWQQFADAHHILCDEPQSNKLHFS